MDQDTLKTQKKVIIEYWKDVDMIPVFINTRNHSHQQCRELSREIFSDLSILFEPTCLTKRKVGIIFDNMVLKISDMLEIDDTTSIMYFGYIKDMFTYYMTECEVNELFESAANCKKFIENFNLYKIF